MHVFVHRSILSSSSECIWETVGGSSLVESSRWRWKEPLGFWVKKGKRKLINYSWDLFVNKVSSCSSLSHKSCMRKESSQQRQVWRNSTNINHSLKAQQSHHVSSLSVYYNPSSSGSNTNILFIRGIHLKFQCKCTLQHFLLYLLLSPYM